MNRTVITGWDCVRMILSGLALALPVSLLLVVLLQTQVLSVHQEKAGDMSRTLAKETEWIDFSEINTISVANILSVAGNVDWPLPSMIASTGILLTVVIISIFYVQANRRDQNTIT